MSRIFPPPQLVFLYSHRRANHPYLVWCGPANIGTAIKPIGEGHSPYSESHICPIPRQLMNTSFFQCAPWCTEHQPRAPDHEAGGHTTRGCVCAFAGHWYLCPPRRPCRGEFASRFFCSLKRRPAFFWIHFFILFHKIFTFRTLTFESYTPSSSAPKYGITPHNISKMSRMSVHEASKPQPAFWDL